MAARALGLNHVALGVGDLDAALAFYGRLFAVRLRGRAPGMAFVDLGDQFIALSEHAAPSLRAAKREPALGSALCGDDHAGPSLRAAKCEPALGSARCRDDDAGPSPAEKRHFGLVVDDLEAVRAALPGTAATVLPGRGLDFLDPWGNHVQVVQYDRVQFTKAPGVLAGMGVDDPGKHPSAREELALKGMADLASGAGGAEPDGRPHELRPIGRVESPLVDRDAGPLQGDEGSPEAWLVLDEIVREGLRDLRRGGEVIVLTWLDRARRDVLSVHPRGDPASARLGVFSTRSPDRPNPIGLHRVEILSIEGTRLRVRDLEALDGTPILDVKPVLDRGHER